MTFRAAFLTCCLLCLAVAPDAQAPPGGVRPVATPAAAGSGMYALARDASVGRSGQERVVLSWLEPAGAGEHALKYATWEGDRWSSAHEVARGPRWFANWADHPSVVPAPGGTLLAHWLVRAGDGTSKYGYGIRVGRRTGPGNDWPVVLTVDPSANDYAGFLAFVPERDGFAAAYLAPVAGPAGAVVPSGGHDGGHAEPVKTLVWASVGTDGRTREQTVLDADVCSCCSVSAAVARQGPIVAYRDRAAGEIRDIAIVRRVDGRWATPRVVHADGWMIPGCPTNGPAIAADGDRVALAWFTAAGGVARVRVAASSDGGASFGAPVAVDDGAPIGWAGVVLLPDGDAVVSWLEGVPGGGAQVRVRRVGRDGRRGPALVVADAKGGRSTGIPQLTLAGDRLLVAWRDDAVRTATLPAHHVRMDEAARPARF